MSQDTVLKTVVPLGIKTKLGYGIGEIGKEIPSSIIVFFLLFFLTNVAGLSPGWAGSVLLVGKVWDAVNDPLVGWLSDRTRSRWGRRFSWMMCGAFPLGLSFWLLWLVPPLTGQGQLAIYYSGVMILFFAALTAVAIPHSTLAAELTQTYDERTQLVSFKAAFSIGSSILGLVIAQIIFATVTDVSRRYVLMGGIFGAIVIVAVYACVWATYDRFWQLQSARVDVNKITPRSSIVQQLRAILRLKPFLYIMGVYLCSWLGLQTTAAILPYFVIDWMELPDRHFTQMVLVVQGTALLMMFVWSPVGQRIGKREIYCLGIPLTVAAQIGLFFLRPDQIFWMYALGAMAGIGLATAYLVPWSMLPDAIDLDELQTGQRREGMFCALLVQLQKLGTALAIFLVGKTLEAAGYVARSGGDDLVLSQPDSALTAIRWILGPLPAIVLSAGIYFAVGYPITRQVHDSIVLKLHARRERSGSA
ncbi:Na+/melibiose symporter [Rubidibacter lacunae KORDI 51-2]|uniref:Na+/melibiose symporter n=1 Tax=Rubidibacter lacunae KORDI 51-2 TaxID=582515 RepID=U5DNJ9_9CHRO|nr:MFS transporter [Rubidibacter lacunae]ERN42447.1 Na+/melibiose symporter [Rubidibacter lacunae KORDI 51-2]